jgi:hypothetical protein
MFKTVVLLSQMYVCVTSGKSLISEVDKTLQEAAFSVTTVRPIGPVRWWRKTEKPTTITWRYWRITKIITLLPIISTTQTTEPVTIATVTEPAPITSVTEPAPVTSVTKPTKVTSLTPSYAQISVISNETTTLTSDIVTVKHLETSTKSKSQLHRERLERDLKLFKGFGILQQILAAFVG